MVFKGPLLVGLPENGYSNAYHSHDLQGCAQRGSLADAQDVRVLDVGCGANLIYPLLGAALHGWKFVGVDVTDAALAGAARNRAKNPSLGPLIELRRSASTGGPNTGA